MLLQLLCALCASRVTTAPWREREIQRETQHGAISNRKISTGYLLALEKLRLSVDVVVMMYRLVYREKKPLISIR